MRFKKDTMIGIDASRAVLKKRTGIEEYSYQVIKHLREELVDESVVLYVRKKIRWQAGRLSFETPHLDFDLPIRWHLKGLWAPRFWTQGRLSLEMWLFPPEVLLVPAHTVPLIHPRRTLVTIHGLEYEFCPQAYSWYERWYMRLSIWCSCWWAQTVICVSENTKRDVTRLYRVSPEKIRVISEGYDVAQGERIDAIHGTPGRQKPYLLFIGRLEERKNVVRLIEAFELLKERYQTPHELVLVGKPGYGYERIVRRARTSAHASEIKSLGYVSETEKWNLLSGAAVFVFPSLYEGFGIPVLEAQAAGVPVVTSNLSSLPEVGGEGVVYVDPSSPESIASGIERILSDEAFKNAIIEKATQNLSRFGWASCAREIARLLMR